MGILYRLSQHTVYDNLPFYQSPPSSLPPKIDSGSRLVCFSILFFLPSWDLGVYPTTHVYPLGPNPMAKVFNVVSLRPPLFMHQFCFRYKDRSFRSTVACLLFAFVVRGRSFPTPVLFQLLLSSKPSDAYESCCISFPPCRRPTGGNGSLVIRFWPALLTPPVHRFGFSTRSKFFPAKVVGLFF